MTSTRPVYFVVQIFKKKQKQKTSLPLLKRKYGKRKYRKSISHKKSVNRLVLQSLQHVKGVQSSHTGKDVGPATLYRFHGNDTINKKNPVENKPTE